MQRIAPHTRLAPGREDEYERVHAAIPADLDGALRAAGDYAGVDEGLPLVWELP